jgi:NADP-reducing hydrogenase subunit HndD
LNLKKEKMTNKINITIDGMNVAVEEGTTVLAAAKKINVRIPTLCYHDDLCVAGNCRVCVVEQEGARGLIAACAMPVHEGMVIHTNTLKVRRSRKHIIELLLSKHNADCTKCYKNGHCELQNLANEYRTGNQVFLDLLDHKDFTIDQTSPSLMKDDSKCIRCQRCVRTCAELQGVNALAVANKGAKQKISSFHDKPMHEVVCTNCGQCINRCPTGALIERHYIDEVWDAILDPEKHVIVQTAPAVRVGLGEALGLEPGERVTGKMVAALKTLRF